jgi:hypothetical protein
MPYVLFHEYFPDIAERETRTVTVLPSTASDLPAGDYGLLEMFCNEAGCDCRRVMFYVVSSVKGDLEAVVAYGWEHRDFYARWSGENDPAMIDELKGPVLNLGSPQSTLGSAILEMIATMVLPDQRYVDRVKRHYAKFRGEVDRRQRQQTPPPIGQHGQAQK